MYGLYRIEIFFFTHQLIIFAMDFHIYVDLPEGIQNLQNLSSEHN
jgi:hypothetical protein